MGFFDVKVLFLIWHHVHWGLELRQKLGNLVFVSLWSDLWWMISSWCWIELVNLFNWLQIVFRVLLISELASSLVNNCSLGLLPAIDILWAIGHEASLVYQVLIWVGCLWARSFGLQLNSVLFVPVSSLHLVTLVESVVVSFLWEFFFALVFIQSEMALSMNILRIF